MSDSDADGGDVEEMVRNVDGEMADLAKAVSDDVQELLDVETEYVSSEYDYDHETHEKTATVRVDVGLADELRERYPGVKLGDSGQVELHLTVDADRA
ncbi:hypothetical protein ACFO0N_03985 [Halobium salinum]|uniref:Asp23/Gls24 family envelope stress response protein n=1 Tax=Halobium salinum TaxID=1364940 RepID=A0ABD5P8R8_9EURY|nr:hypothetical protein [Halobium salinum]